MHLTPMKKALLPAIETRKAYSTKCDFKVCRIRSKENLCRTIGPETRRRHQAQQFAQKLIVVQSELSDGQKVVQLGVLVKSDKLVRVVLFPVTSVANFTLCYTSSVYSNTSLDAYLA